MAMGHKRMINIDLNLIDTELLRVLYRNETNRVE